MIRIHSYLLTIAVLLVSSDVVAFNTVAPTIGHDRKVVSLYASMINRRSSLATLAKTAVTSSVAITALCQPAVASSPNNRPRAPLSALIPATQKLVSMERAVVLSSKLLDASTTEAQKTENIQELRSILLEPPPDGYSSSDNSMTRWSQRKIQQLQSSDSIGTDRLSGSSVRAAFNLYTANLRFGEDYVVQDTEWKKSYIRENDGLPDVKQVIIADLDLRDLYRNEVQLKIDDAQAELYSENFDAEELNVVLKQALKVSDLWFEMIDPLDVKEARENAAAQVSR